MTGKPAGQDIAWSDAFLIGIEALDYEHRGLVDDINRLHRELLGQVDRGRIEDTLGMIHSRMQAHFALEERVMQANDYVHYAEHKAEHERLLDEYAEYMTTLESNPTLGERSSIENVLREWIIDHILAYDKKMSQMIASSGKR